MRYRMELWGGIIQVRNVETDLIMGFVRCHCERDKRDPNQIVDTGITVLDRKLNWVATTPTPTFLELPSLAIGDYEERNGYPDFSPLDNAADPRRVEKYLGTTVADIICELARGLLEKVTGDLTLDTNERVIDLLELLYNIRYVSRFGSWNAERRSYEPYFAHPDPAQPRLVFRDAVREYGLRELQERFPSESEATLQKVLWWPIEFMHRRDMVLIRPPSPRVQQLAAAALSEVRLQVRS